MARNNYYSNNYAPHFFIDGNIDGESNRGAWDAMIEQETYNDAPLFMNMWGTFMPESLAGYITVQIITETNPGLNNYKLRVVLTESDINWRAPNGATIHHETMRDMMPSAGGQGISIVVGDTLEYTYRYTTPTPVDPNNCTVLAFVQADINRTILQSARVSIPQLTPVVDRDGELVPNLLTLSQNYPNPFNAQTRIEYTTVGGNVSLAVYDLTGALVKTLVDGSQTAGAHSVIWDGRDNSGKTVASGVYFYNLRDAKSNQVKHMTLLK